ncbi:hypothetical protein ZWY2020_021153 [Hordeum vulgare]|nr:hypothetical protein ZWY2020_021153 [Hordeum vulgare]
MLKTAVVQNAQFSHSLERLHSTPQASYTRSRPEDQPAVNSEPRHFTQDNPPERNPPGRDLPNIQDAPAPLACGGGRVGVPCLSSDLRNERMPKDFKGPRKVPNYTPDLEPTSWIEGYEIAMDMLDVNEVVCARYFTMMLEGSARTWLKNLPPNSIQSWAELKERFIKNFRGTCKRPMTIVDLQHCVQRPDEWAHHWLRRVAEIIHSSDGIMAAQTVLILEHNCHYEPLVQKLGRLKRKVQDMGELMDTLTRRDKKVSHQAYSVTEPAIPRYLHWFEQTITWSREDHTPRIDNPGDLALVVAPQMRGYTLSKVLVDGGSSINILYFDTFQRMNLLDKDLMPSTMVFHGIVLGKSAYPIGRVRLSVAFGTAQNYRSESLIFKVVKLKSPYHALFGRPAYARFMARSCYVYLKLKMPGPKGTITVDGDRRIAKECEEGDAAYAEVACAAEELKHHRANVDPADMSPLKKPTTDSESPLKFKPTDDTKTIDFVPGDSSKQFTIGTGLDPK